MRWIYPNTGHKCTVFPYALVQSKTLTSVVLKVKKRSESSSTPPYTVLAKQDQETEQQRAKTNTHRLKQDHWNSKNYAEYFNAINIETQFHTKMLYLQHIVKCYVTCWWWGCCSPPLAYSIIRYKVFSVSITSNSWTATNGEAVTSYSQKHEQEVRWMSWTATHLCLDDSAFSWCVPLETTKKKKKTQFKKKKKKEWSNSSFPTRIESSS